MNDSDSGLDTTRCDSGGCVLSRHTHPWHITTNGYEWTMHRPGVYLGVPQSTAGQAPACSKSGPIRKSTTEQEPPP